MLILVRHGQTSANAAGTLLGRADLPLTDLGRAQAKAIARALAGTVDRVVSSPLLRARDTAACLGLPVEIDERWIELDYGVFEGEAFGLGPAEVWQRWRADPEFAPDGGESLAAVGRRVRAACDELAAEAAERDVVVFSHVSPIKAAASWALGAGDSVGWRMFLDVAAIGRIAISPLGPVLRTWNEAQHLAGVIDEVASEDAGHAGTS